MKESALPIPTTGMASADGVWLQRHLGPVLAEYMKREGVGPSDWRGQPLADDEVAGFRRAIEQQMIHVDEGDACLVLTAFSAVKRYRLFQTYASGAASPGRSWSWSWRECFTQIAFACELANEHAWPTNQIAFEVGALDLAVGVHPTSQPVILAEAKVHEQGQAGLKGMLAVFDELGGGPPAGVGPQVRLNATRKYADIVRMKPRVFAAVAPGARRIFDVECADELAVLSDREAGISSSDLVG